MSISQWRIYTALEVKSSRGVGEKNWVDLPDLKDLSQEDFSTLQSMLRLRDCAGDLLED